MSKRGQKGTSRKFGNGEAKVYEFGDGEAEIYHTGAAKYERFRQPGECKGGTRRCCNMRLETSAKYPAEHTQERQQQNTQKCRFLETGKREAKIRTQLAFGIKREVRAHTRISQEQSFATCNT